MRLNPTKFQSITVSRSRTIIPQHPPLFMDGSQITIGCLVLFYKILHNPNHPLYIKLPGPFIQRRTTRYGLSLNDRAFSAIFCRTNQFSRSFLPYICKIWNKLPNSVVNSPDLQSFKTAVNDFYLRLQM